MTDCDCRLEQLAGEREALTAELTSARQQLQQQQSSSAELQQQLADSRQAAEAAAAELAEYKLKGNTPADHESSTTEDS